MIPSPKRIEVAETGSLAIILVLTFCVIFWASVFAIFGWIGVICVLTGSLVIFSLATAILF